MITQSGSNDFHGDLYEFLHNDRWTHATFSQPEWVSRSAFQRLDPVAQAGQFGNEGRNVVPALRMSISLY
ncbi:MAG TPA: hypothetical protein VN610_05885 [Bryobacteraceae bacterium]|nr:hypothetical protein [Bryobacteraceae bacterium]